MSSSPDQADPAPPDRGEPSIDPGPTWPSPVPGLVWATTPSLGAGGQWAAPPPPRPPSRRHRPFRLLALLIGVTALVGGAIVAAVTAIQVSPPTQVVEKYFAALRAGDAPAALSYGNAPPGNHSFLTSTALAAQNRLAAIGSVRVDPATVSGRTARVPVTYTLTPAAAPTRPSIQTTDVALHRRGRGWSLDRAAAVVRVRPTGAGRRATLAGAAVPTGPVALFPGVVPVRYDTALIEQRLDSGYVTLTSTGTVSVGAQLSAAGRAAVETAVRTAFATCLARPTAAASRSCPLTPSISSRPVPGSLRGSLRRATFGVAPVLRDADGLVRTSGTFSVAGRYQSLDYDNIAATDTGTVPVTFAAAVYVTAPRTVRWEQP
jgi:hypothetical protein